MPDRLISRGRGLLDRAARVAFAFVVLNCAAVAALGAVVTRRRLWR